MPLCSEQKQILEQEYSIYFSKKKVMMHQFHGTDLLQTEKLSQLLGILEASFHSPNRIVTASLFVKYYGYLLISAGFYGMTQLKQNLNLSLSNITLEINDKWDPIIIVKREPGEPGSEPIILETVRSLFPDNLKPVFLLLSELTGIKTKTLWAHASFAVYYLYDLLSRKLVMTKEDLDIILHEIKELDIDIQVIDHPLNAGERLRIRKECCLHFCLPSGIKCTTCPNLKDQERIDALKAKTHR